MSDKPPAEKLRRTGYPLRGYTFGTGGMPMPPPPGGAPAGPPMMPPPGGAPMPPQGGNPAAAIQQKIAQAPPKDRAKIKKLIKGTIKAAIKAQQGGGGMPPPGAGAPPPPGPPGPPMPPPGMKKGGKVKKAGGGAVRGIGLARKGGGRGRFV